MSAIYTCITCHVAFTDPDVQRTHYKTDWHRYNLKRKVVSLAPVTADEFRSKVAAQKELAASNKSQDNVVGLSCKVCQRKFGSFNAHENHLNSKKHKDAAKRELDLLRKNLEVRQQAHVEKNIPDEVRELNEENAIKKAISDAENDLKQPVVLRNESGAAPEKKEKKIDPRFLWYKKQMQMMKQKEEEDEEVVADDNDDDSDWEDMTDDDGETITDSEDVTSQSGSVSGQSSVSGIMSRLKMDSDADVESVRSEQQDIAPQRLIGPLECLFCAATSADVEENIFHMSTTHSFFIPELPYLLDVEGLLAYLGEKVGVGNVCLWCNERGQAFRSLRAVRQHMSDKGHCKIYTERDAALEYADFYDFTTSYPDYENNNGEFAEMDDDSAEMEDDSVEVSSINSEGMNALRYQLTASGDDEYELVLPSGAQIGHRSLMRYYKQKFPTVDRTSSQKPRIDRLMAQYKAIGWSGGPTSAIVRKFRQDVKFVQSLKAKHNMRLGGKNNKTMMKHFRPQVIF